MPTTKDRHGHQEDRNLHDDHRKEGSPRPHHGHQKGGSTQDHHSHRKETGHHDRHREENRNRYLHNYGHQESGSPRHQNYCQALLEEAPLEQETQTISVQETLNRIGWLGWLGWKRGLSVLHFCADDKIYV